MIRTCTGVRSLHGTSEWSAESSIRTACRNHADFQGDWHESFEPYSWSSTRTFIILCPTPNQTRAFQSRQNKISKADQLICSTLWCWCFVPLCRSETNTVKMPECMLWKRNTRQRCPSSLRTAGLFPVSHDNSDLAQSPSQEWRQCFCARQQCAMATSINI